MSSPDRTEAIETLDDGHRRILSLTRGLTDAQMTLRRAIGGGDWSVKDLLAHVTTWEEAALGSLAAWRAGSSDPVREALKAGGVDAFNARRVRAKGRMPLSVVRKEFRSVHRQLIEEVATMTDWETVPPGRRSRSAGSVIGSITGGPGGDFRHAWAHLGDLESYVRSLG